MEDIKREIKVFNESPEEFYLYHIEAFNKHEISPGELGLIGALMRIEKKLDMLIDISLPG